MEGAATAAGAAQSPPVASPEDAVRHYHRLFVEQPERFASTYVSSTQFRDAVHACGLALVAHPAAPLAPPTLVRVPPTPLADAPRGGPSWRTPADPAPPPPPPPPPADPPRSAFGADRPVLPDFLGDLRAGSPAVSHPPRRAAVPLSSQTPVSALAHAAAPAPASADRQPPHRATLGHAPTHAPPFASRTAPAPLPSTVAGLGHVSLHAGHARAVPARHNPAGGLALETPVLHPPAAPMLAPTVRAFFDAVPAAVQSAFDTTASQLAPPLPLPLPHLAAPTHAVAPGLPFSSSAAPMSGSALSSRGDRQALNMRAVADALEPIAAPQRNPGRRAAVRPVRVTSRTARPLPAAPLARAALPHVAELLERQAWDLYEHIRPEDNEKERRTRLLAHMNKVVRSEWPDGCVRMFGSGASGLNLRGGDVDMCLVVPPQPLHRRQRRPRRGSRGSTAGNGRGNGRGGGNDHGGQGLLASASKARGNASAGGMGGLAHANGVSNGVNGVKGNGSAHSNGAGPPVGDDETAVMSDKQIMKGMASILRRSKMTIIRELLGARVPILKVGDAVSGFQIDVCLNNELGHYNTALLAAYGAMDPRMKPLCLIVKYWAKRRAINDAYRGTLSSYAYVMLIIFFLQTRPIPVLPCLQQMHRGVSVMDGAELPVCTVYSQDGVKCNVHFDDTISSFDAGNRDSLAELLIAFLHFFAYEFRYREDVVSPRLGCPLSRAAKGWDEATVELELEQADNRAVAEQSERAQRDARGMRRMRREMYIDDNSENVGIVDEENFPVLGSAIRTSKIPLQREGDEQTIAHRVGGATGRLTGGMPNFATGYSLGAPQSPQAASSNGTDTDNDDGDMVRRDQSLRSSRKVTRHVFCIEDPFDLSHDLGRNLDGETLDVVRHEFVRAHAILVMTGDIHRMLEKYEEAE